jgi:hypothetical protein
MRLRENEIHKVGAGTIVLRRLFDTNIVRGASFGQQRRSSLGCAFRAVNLPANRCLALSQLPVPTGAERLVGSHKVIVPLLSKGALSVQNGVVEQSGRDDHEKENEYARHEQASS